MSQWLKDTFGDGGALAIQFVFALIVVLVLLAIFAWLLRRFTSGRFGSTAGRNRQPRLAIMDAAPIDTRRRLVLVRRDNVEHLLLIGGPTDVVVEQQIVRGMPVGTPHPRAVDRGAARRSKPEPGTAEVPAAAAATAGAAAKASAAPARPEPARAEKAPTPKPEQRDNGANSVSDIERAIAQRLDDGIRKAPREAAPEEVRVNPETKPVTASAAEAPKRGFTSLRSHEEKPAPAPEPEIPAAQPVATESEAAPVRSPGFDRPAAPEFTAAPPVVDEPAAAEPAEPEPSAVEAEPQASAEPEEAGAEPEKSAKEMDSLEDEMAKLLGEIAGRPKS